MVDIIVVLIVVILLGFALKGSIKHFKGDSPCCGGGGGTVVLDIPDKKLDKPVLGKKVLKISGMHCEHCVKAVTEAINKVDGASAKVNLSENEAVVSYDRELDEEQLRSAVTKAYDKLEEMGIGKEEVKGILHKLADFAKSLFN